MSRVLLARLRADPLALMGCCRRQVVYRLASGVPPAGYGIAPAVRAIPVRLTCSSATGPARG